MTNRVEKKMMKFDQKKIIKFEQKFKEQVLNETFNVILLQTGHRNHRTYGI